MRYHYNGHSGELGSWGEMADYVCILGVDWVRAVFAVFGCTRVLA
jgi:hypothetical protein